MKPRVIVYPDADPGQEDLAGCAAVRELERFGRFVMHIGRPASPREYIERVAGASGILLGWDLPVEVMRAAPELEVVSFTGIGAGKFVDLEAASAQRVTVCNAPGYADNTVAEHTLALTLAACRQVARLDRELRAGRWNQAIAGMELRGKQVGLVGFGGIGQRVCQLFQALGCRVRVWNRTRRDDLARQYGIAFESLEQVLTGSDVVSLHVAHTPDTEGIIGAAELGMLGPGAILVNTARGELVDEAALTTALGEGRIGAAALDVYTREPLPPDHPLCRLDNVVLTPHIAFNTPEATRTLFDIAIANLSNYYAGTPTNVVGTNETNGTNGVGFD